MGMADLIPGISGGTIAFILGIYERLMQALKSLNTDALYHFTTLRWNLVREEVDFRTLLGVLFGILFAFFFFTQIIALKEWVAYYKPQFYAFFFGLVFATVILFLTQQSSAKFLKLVMLLAGAALGITLTAIEINTLPNTRPYIFLSGMIAVSAMLLPGISGSYLLLMLGKYELMLNAATVGHWPTLGIFLAGGIIGALVFVRLISWLLQHYHGTVLMFITGLIAGTLPQLWPLRYAPPQPEPQLLGILGGLMLIGVATIFILNWLRVKLSD